MKRAATVDDYFATLPPASREPLMALRKAIAAELPEATEAITYQMPTVKVDGRSLLAYAAFANHYSIFPMSKAVIAGLGDRVAAHATGKGTLRFELDGAVPTEILKAVVTARLAELETARRR